MWRNPVGDLEMFYGDKYKKLLVKINLVIRTVEMYAHVYSTLTKGKKNSRDQV